MENGKDNPQPSAEASPQPSMEFFSSSAAMIFLKSLYDVGKDSGVLFSGGKPFCQLIDSEFINDQHVVELKLNNTSNHSIKILSIFEKGKRALTDSLNLELREREQHFTNGHITVNKYYKERGYMDSKPVEKTPQYVTYPLLIESNFSYRLRISLPLQPKPQGDENLGVTLICKVAELERLSNKAEKIKVRLFWPD